MKRIALACLSLAVILPAFAQGALDVLDRASRSSADSYGRTMDNAHRRTQMDQINTEQAWFNRCMYQTGGDAAKCSGIRQTQLPPRPEPQGTPARLVSEGGQVQTVTGLWATKCLFEVNGQQFTKVFASCPSTIYVH